MPFLPVAAREVREASRQTRTYGWRCGAAGAALGLMAFVGFVTRTDPSQGQAMFMASSAAAFIYCMLAGVVRTADTLAEEKRENTLGLLFLTDLKGWDIVSGKVLSSSINCFFGLVAMMPILAIPLMMGGVSGAEFARVFLGLLNALFFSITLGILISSIFRQSAVTISMGLLAGIFMGGILPLGCILLREEYHLNGLSTFLFLFTPLQGLVMGFDANVRGPMSKYWWSLAVNHGMAWANLGLAVYFLPRLWQEAPKNKKAERWRDRLRRWRFGAGREKAKFRTRLLDQNPLYWLSSRDRVSSGALMTIAGLILATGLICGAIAVRRPFSGPEALMIAWFVALGAVHVMIAFRVAMSASSRLAEDRRSGALELILGTEISVKDVLRGHWMGLRRQFFGPAVLIICATLFALALVLLTIAAELRAPGVFHAVRQMIEGFAKDGNAAEMFLIFLIAVSIMTFLCLNWIGLGWVGMWLGLREKRTGFATWTTLALVLCPPWLILIVSAMIAEDAGFFQRVSAREGIPYVLGYAWMLGLGHLALVSFWARRNLLNRFREAAADRFMVTRWLTWLWARRMAIRLAAVCLVLYAVFAMTGMVIDRRGEAAWKKALGAHPTFSLNPTNETRATPRVPDAENLARAPLLLPLSAARVGNWPLTWTMTRLNTGWHEQLAWDWARSRRSDLHRTEEFYLTRKAITKARATPAETALAVLSAYDKQLATLHAEAKARPRTEFAPVPMSPPGNVYYYGSGRAALRSLVDVLVLRASAHIARNEPALDDILLGLRLADGVRDGTSMIDRHQMLLDLTQSVYDGMTLRRWNANELKQIQERFAALELWAQYDAWREQYLRATFKGLEGAVAARNGGPRRQRSLVDRFLPDGFIRMQQADLLAWGYELFPKAVDTKGKRIDPARWKELEAVRPDRGAHRRGQDELRLTLNSFGIAQTVADEIVLACAIERYRLDHARLPATLGELAPNYVSAIPNDVFTGQPLVYKIKANREHYTLNGFGPDGVDNNGAPMPMGGGWMLWQDLSGSDCVWDSQGHEPPPPKKRRNR